MNMASLSADQALAFVEKNYREDEECGLAVIYILKFMTARKHNWSIQIEKLMVHFINFAIYGKAYSNIKEGLKAFRSISQSIAVNSLEEVLQYYKERIESLFEARCEEFSSTRENLIQLDDIELEATADDLLEGTIDVFTKESRDEIRNSMKTLWDCYKNIVETVRHNPKLESIYNDTLKSMFSFAQRYRRKAEFKRFCDLMRNNFQAMLQKGKEKVAEVSRETQNDSHLTQRFNQLETALNLGLWFDAFQILEDINLLIKLRSMKIKRAVLEKYFLYLAILFQKSNYSHYYAVSFYHHYEIYRRSDRRKNPEAMTAKTDDLILAVLSIFPENEKLQSESSKAKIVALITSSSGLPSKVQLQHNIEEMDLLALASPSVRRLWLFLKEGFSLTRLPAMREDFSSLNKLVVGGSEMLEKNIVMKVLENMSQIYRSIRLSRLFAIVPFPQQKVLEILLRAQEARVLRFDIDERKDILQFRAADPESQSPAQRLLDQAVGTRLALLAARQQPPPEDLSHSRLEALLNDRKLTSEKYFETVRKLLDMARKEQEAR